jgi:hypothetical protein
MKYILLISILIAILGCKPKSENPHSYFEVEGGRIKLDDPRQALYMDFQKITKHPELIDEDYANGDFQYMFYKEDDFVTVSICGVDDEDIINSVINEFKSVLKKREIEQYLVVNIYESKTRIDDSRASLGKLINTLEIKNF